MLKAFSPKDLETNKGKSNVKTLRGDLKKVSFYLPAHLNRMIRMMAVDEETSMSEVISSILEEWGRTHEKLTT